MSDQRPRPTDECTHEWVSTGPGADGSRRTLGSRCLHCGRYSYRPSPPSEPRTTRPR